MERKQGQHETFRDYVSDMHNLHFKLKHKIDEDEFVELLKDNMNSRMGAARDDPLAHECVKGREYGQHTARSYCDEATAKLVGQCGLMTDELDDYYYFSRHF